MIAALGLMRRSLETQAAYTLARLRLLARLPGNPFGVVWRQIGEGCIAAMARQLPLSPLNRVCGLGAGSAAEIEPLRAWYEEAGVRGRFDTHPGAYDPALQHELTRLGYYQSHFEVCLACPPQRRPADAAAAVERLASAARLDTWLAACGQSLAKAAPPMLAMLRAGLNDPDWSIYLAAQAGQAAAAVMFRRQAFAHCELLAGSAAPEQGLERALFSRVLADAGEAGVDFVLSEADLLSQRHYSLIAMSCKVVFVRAAWSRL